MTALEALKTERQRIGEAMAVCVTDSGFVKNDFKYRYQLLVREAKAVEESIKYMESLRKGRETVSK